MHRLENLEITCRVQDFTYIDDGGEFDMKLQGLSAYLTTLVVSLSLFGCSSGGSGTNRTMEFVNPNISVISTEADVEIGEQVSGEGCSNEYLSFFKTGDSNFLGGEITKKSTPEDRAKAAAAYNALTKGRGLTTDILVQPVWQVTHSRTLFGWVSDSTCARVVGYRGVIKGFRKKD